MANPLTSIELFTGAGGLALGVSQAGFKHVALIELNKNACASLNDNVERVADMRGWPRPIVPIDARRFDFRPHEGRVNLLAAGAPCQPFSLGGKHRSYRDERNLFPEVFRATRELRPDVVLVENVKGLLRSTFREYFDYIILQLEFPLIQPEAGETWRTHKTRLAHEKGTGRRRGLRYNVQAWLLNAADYGLSQHRERVFIVGVRRDLGMEIPPPAVTHSEDTLLYAQWVDRSYWREHGLRAPSTPTNLKSRVVRLEGQGEAFLALERWRTVRDAIRHLPEPKDGVEHPDIPCHVGNPGARAYPGHTGSPLDRPAKTLKAGDHGVPGGENTLRRDDGSVRYFTVREAARLQGFPDEYRFHGAWCEAFRQIGNAVPVDLARAVALKIRTTLEAASRASRVA